MSGPPPPPPMLSLPVSSDSGGEQGRNMLLQSIRAGKPLKKTVTVDKSAPVITGKMKGELPSTPSSTGGNNNNSSSNNSSINNNSNTGLMGLGGLFAGGMPKLKQTGLRGDITERDNISSNVTHTSNTNTNAKRGPPPIPPPATQKPQIFQSVTDSVSTNSEAAKGFGKPTLVPKPLPPPTVAPQKPSPPPFIAPQKPSPPPKKINLSSLHSTSGGGVMRAQSMRVPRSPPVLAPTMSSLHQSQDCLNDPPPPPRPTPRHPRPPVTRPPPPPPSRITAAPSMPPPPPPPPHRSGNSHQRHAPPPPPPPTPPTRGSSMMRNGQSSSWMDFETRFADAFHPISTFPLPEPFKGFPKVYNSRNAAKQQAPAPPPTTSNTMLQLNSTHGGRQWPPDAASSAC